jgi:hypothetical protein
MLPSLINPLSILLTITTSFGVLIHDTHMDRATTAALALPIAFAVYGASEAIKMSDPHVHTERVNVANTLQQLRSNQPKLQTRDDKDRMYVSVKKYMSGGMGSEYHWPSV